MGDAQRAKSVSDAAGDTIIGRIAHYLFDKCGNCPSRSLCIDNAFFKPRKTTPLKIYDIVIADCGNVKKHKAGKIANSCANVVWNSCGKSCPCVPACIGIAYKRWGSESNCDIYVAHARRCVVCKELPGCIEYALRESGIGVLGMIGSYITMFRKCKSMKPPNVKFKD